MSRVRSRVSRVSRVSRPAVHPASQSSVSPSSAAAVFPAFRTALQDWRVMHSKRQGQAILAEVCRARQVKVSTKQDPRKCRRQRRAHRRSDPSFFPLVNYRQYPETQRCQPTFFFISTLSQWRFFSSPGPSINIDTSFLSESNKNVGHLCSQKGIHREVGRYDSCPVSFRAFLSPFRHLICCIQKQHAPAPATAAAHSPRICSCH